MRQTLKTHAIAWVLAIVIGFFPLAAAAATAGTSVPEKLVVGVMELPPFTMRTETGEWKGLSIGLVQAVAQDLDTTVELREFSRVDQLENALASGKIDLSPVVAIMERLEPILDYSNPYHHSGSAIAVKTESGIGLLHLVRQLFSIASFKVIVSLGLLWLIAGLLVWLFERQRESNMFNDRFLHGIGNGIWWASVTMTTVGYGDKAPRTIGGRVVAIVWMFASIVLISSFTATAATTLTLGELRGRISGFNDLPGVRVGTLARSEYLETLVRYGIQPSAFNTIPAGLEGLSAGEIDAFVHDEALLKHLIRTRYAGTLHVLPDTFNHYYLCMALPPGSDLREALNRSLLEVTAREDWRLLLKRYSGRSQK